MRRTARILSLHSSADCKLMPESRPSVITAVKFENAVAKASPSRMLTLSAKNLKTAVASTGVTFASVLQATHFRLRANLLRPLWFTVATKEGYFAQCDSVRTQDRFVIQLQPSSRLRSQRAYFGALPHSRLHDNAVGCMVTVCREINTMETPAELSRAVASSAAVFGKAR
jgi:hypothetical protein